MTDIYTIIPYERNKQLIKLSRPKIAKIYYSNHSLNLLSGKEESDCIQTYLEELDNRLIEQKENTLEIHHLFYELADIILFNKNNEFQVPLAIKIIYSKKENVSVRAFLSSLRLTNIFQPELQEYLNAFNQGREELLNGNSYQFNYTSSFRYGFENNSVDDFLNSFLGLKEKMGQFAHFTWLASLNKIIFSNSPEGLFQARARKNHIECITTPIKGTIKRVEGKSIKEQWKELKNDSKNQGELFMIVDLLRNDLSSIEKPVAQVIKKKARLIVPGLIHQMGIIKVRFSKAVTLGRVVRSLFPGGSITGAPKKSTVNILKRLERAPRGIYTGSTLFIQQNQVDCSINIRTADIDLGSQELMYGAGGGVTLLSKHQEEFQEMYDKVNSFIGIL